MPHHRKAQFGARDRFGRADIEAAGRLRSGHTSVLVHSIVPQWTTGAGQMIFCRGAEFSLAKFPARDTFIPV